MDTAGAVDEPLNRGLTGYASAISLEKQEFFLLHLCYAYKFLIHPLVVAAYTAHISLWKPLLSLIATGDLRGMISLRNSIFQRQNIRKRRLSLGILRISIGKLPREMVHPQDIKFNIPYYLIGKYVGLLWKHDELLNEIIPIISLHSS